MNLSVCTLTLYTLPSCPRCDEVGEMLTTLGHFYIIKSMDDPETLADMRFEGFFGMEAPVRKTERRVPHKRRHFEMEDERRNKRRCEKIWTREDDR